MNIFQILGQLDKLTEFEPNHESVQKLQSFLETEASVPFDSKLVILPEYFQEMYGKAVELLLRGYPGIDIHSTPSLIFKMLEHRFRVHFPVSVHGLFQPDKRTASIMDIYQRFSKAILNPREQIEYVDFGRFFFRNITTKSKKDMLWEGLTSSPNDREGAIVVTNQRLLIVGPRAIAGQEKITLLQFFLYDTDSPHFASADFFNKTQIEEVQPFTRLHFLNFIMRGVKFIETKAFSIYLSPVQVWARLHEDTAVKQGDFQCYIDLQEFKNQKKDVLRNRYRTLESKIQS